MGFDSSILKSRSTLGSTDNLNNITQSGVYAINPNTVGSNPINSPSTAGVLFGSLVVFGPSTTAGNPVTQIYITSYNSLSVYMRSSWDGIWLGWAKII